MGVYPEFIVRTHLTLTTHLCFITCPATLRHALSVQNLTQIETPWEGVTLNRCLIATITLLLLSSALQRIHEAVRGRRDVSEELTALNERHTLIQRGKITPHEPDTSLWEKFFWWIDADEGKSKRATGGKISRGLRHRALTDLRLLKKRDTEFTERRRRGRHGEDETEEKEMKVKKAKEVEEEEKDIEKMKKQKKESKKTLKKKENQ
ncbi:uncharacterized protein LOC132096941 [Carassius carassius]|uniref:uncharacterized protein LOC132096941 n=1 Tax=Carassius carassius TaxID=217509 RepID=UPI0028695563|nr:uncharacterized protein LOC132096941 [Carassius carassius]